MNSAVRSILSGQINYSSRQLGFGEAILLSGVGVVRDFPRHRHDYYGFALIDEGVESYYARGSHHLITSADTVLLNPEDVHTGGPYANERWSYRMLIVEPETVAAMANDHDNYARHPLFQCPIVRDLETRSRLTELMAAHATLPELFEELILEFYAFVAVRHGGDRFRHTPDDAGKLRVLRDMLLEQPFRSLSLADLSAASNLSRTYLVTAFRRRYGLSPMAFQLQHRLARARYDLLRSDQPIARIAVENGFYDQSDLNRHFYRIFGISPFQMRRQIGFHALS